MDVFTLPDGRQIGHGVAFVSNDEQFPPNWLELATSDDLAAKGIGKQTLPDFAPQITAGMIVAERERRLGLGFNYDFGDARGVHRIETSAADMVGWDAVTKIAQAAINIGQPSATIDIVTNTGAVTVTALEWQSILLAAGRFQQPIWAKSFALQAMSPIPSTYASDEWWTA